MKYSFGVFVLLMVSIVCFGQVNVAILDPVTGEDSNVTSMEKAMLRGELRKAIFSVDGWAAVTRSDIDQVLNELDFQRMGYVPKSEVRRVGQMSGADYLCISTLNKSDTQFYLEAYLVEVSSGNIESPASQFGEVKNGNMVNLYNVCQLLVKELIGNKVVTSGTAVEENFDGKTDWGWTIFSHDSKSAQIANDELRITNFATTGTTQSNVMVPVDVNKKFQITFQFVIQEAKMLSSVGVKFGGNCTFVVNTGTCTFTNGTNFKTSSAAKMGLGRNRPVTIDLISDGEMVVMMMNGLQVFEEACEVKTNQMGVFAGINTLAMLKKVTVKYVK